MTGDRLDREKVTQKCDLSIEACMMRVAEMDEVCSGDWEKKLADMLEGPFTEQEQLTRQALTGDEAPLTRYQRLDVALERLEADYEKKVAQIGKIDRLGLEDRADGLTEDQVLQKMA